MGNYVAAQRYPYGNYVITPTIPKCEQKLLSGDPVIANEIETKKAAT